MAEMSMFARLGVSFDFRIATSANSPFYTLKRIKDYYAVFRIL